MRYSGPKLCRCEECRLERDVQREALLSVWERVVEERAQTEAPPTFHGVPMVAHTYRMPTPQERDAATTALRDALIKRGLRPPDPPELPPPSP